MWLVTLDLRAAESIPEGFGHLYSSSANIDAWVAMTEPDGWTEADRAALKELLATDG